MTGSTDLNDYAMRLIMGTGGNGQRYTMDDYQTDTEKEAIRLVQNKKGGNSDDYVCVPYPMFKEDVFEENNIPEHMKRWVDVEHYLLHICRLGHPTDTGRFYIVYNDTENGLMMLEDVGNTHHHWNGKEGEFFACSPFPEHFYVVVSE